MQPTAPKSLAVMPEAPSLGAERLYFGLDIESGGRHASDTLVAVGLCVASTRDGVLHKLRVVPPDGNRFEPRCIIEYWSKNAHLLQIFETEKCASVCEALGRIEQLLSWERQTCPPGAQAPSAYNERAVLVSDNPAYDVAHLDAAMERWRPGHVPLHYTRAGAYRPVQDPSERVDALGLDGAKLKAFLGAINVRHTHMPDDDAEHHVWLLFLAKAYAQLLATREELTPKAARALFYEKLSAADARKWVLFMARQHDGDA